MIWTFQTVLNRTNDVKCLLFKNHCFTMPTLHKATFCIIVSVLFVSSITSSENGCTSIEFDRETTGVIFSPYVDHRDNREDYEDDYFMSYSIENIKTMLEMVSSKFSKISTYGNIRRGDTYLQNSTYFKSHREIYTAEAAAMINRDSNLTSLEVQLGIHIYNDKQDIQVSTRLAVEAAQKANKIYPGTVTSYIFYAESFLSNSLQAEDILRTFQDFRNSADLMGLKVGIRLRECSKYGDALQDSRENDMTLMMKNILNQSDFVVCNFRPFGNEHNSNIGLKYIKPFLLSFRNNVHKINPSIDVMGETYWVCKDPQRSANIDYIRTYWKIVNDFASEYNFSMWMYEAFDNPWQPSESVAHRGWWTLKRSNIGSLEDGLTEKMSGRCTPFNRNMTGVVFSPYVLRKMNEKAPSFKAYSLADIKTMLALVLSKFSRIATTGRTSEESDTYVWNSTYYESYLEILTAEAAAMINRERNQTRITLYLGVWVHKEERQTYIAAQIALEAILKANEISPGTVNGLIFKSDKLFSDVQKAQQVSLYLMKFRNILALQKIKMGFHIQDCKFYKHATMDEYKILRMMIHQSDFVICSIPSSDQFKGPKVTFEVVKSDLLRFRDVIRTMNPMIEVMGETFWPNFGPELEPWLSIDNMREYWILVNEFTVEWAFPMWLNEAFDTPWRNGEYAHLGWWRLKSNSKVNSTHGYTENYLAPVQQIFPNEKVHLTDEQEALTLDYRTILTDQSSMKREDDGSAYFWVYIGSGTAVTVGLLLVAVTVIIFLKINKNTSVLTRQDVQEFLSGVSANYFVCPSSKKNAVIQSVLKLPYNKSYEIAKDALQIENDVLLGSGQFGMVFKATLNKEEGAIEIALKIAKPDCNKSTLKGFLSEIKILMYLGKHENIVSIQGAYTAELLSGIVYIATELCSMGSLLSFLRRSQFRHTREYENAIKSPFYTNDDLITDNDSKLEAKKPEVSIVDMVKWSYQIACGMEFLGTKSVVHADLALRNVLLTTEKAAKIADFGLSRRLYDYTNYVKEQQEPLPWRWMSIEALKQMLFSSKSDVWSYGVTLWEIFSKGDVPYPGFSLTPDFVDQLIKGMRMKSPVHATSDIYRIMIDCWDVDPGKRPTFENLKISIANILDNVDNTYDNLFE